MIDRGQVKLITNLDAKPQDFDVPAGTRLIAQSNAGIDILDGTITLPANSLAIFSSEEE